MTLAILRIILLAEINMPRLRFLVLLISASTISCNRDEDDGVVETSSDSNPPVLERYSGDSHSLTKEILWSTYLPVFSFEDDDLDYVLRHLSEESKKYGQMIGYKPVQFRAHRFLGKTKVNLTGKGNTMLLICEMLAEQTQAELQINPNEVVFLPSVTTD